MATRPSSGTLIHSNITRAPAKKPGMHLPVEYKSFDRTFAPAEEQVRGV
jgi:hypothetical protein